MQCGNSQIHEGNYYVKKYQINIFEMIKIILNLYIYTLFCKLFLLNLFLIVNFL